MGKVWYQIEVECISNSNHSMVVGDKDIVAKVKSKGLAYVLASKLSEVYKPDNFKINIK